MEMTVGQAIGILAVVLVVGSFIMGCLDAAAEERNRQREIEDARRWQMKGSGK